MKTMKHDLARWIQPPAADQRISPAILEDYIAYIDAAPATVRAYGEAVKLFCNYLHAQGISQPTRETVIAYREQLKTYCRPTTVQNYIEALKIFFSWTEQRGLYPNIANHIKGAKISSDFKKDNLTPRQLKKILNGIDRETETGLRDYAILVTMLTGSLRCIELHRANIEDLGTASGFPVLYLQGKGRDDRTDYVKLPEQTEAAIKAYLRSRKAADPREPLFTSQSNNSQGQRLSTRSISGIAKKYLIQAGFNSHRYTAHSIRHSGITISLQGGNTLQETQLYARHKSINTTLKYAHNLNRSESRCAESIAAAVLK